MNTYRFNWNPSTWHWPDLPERLQELAETGSTTDRWSTGRSKQPKLGDRVLLLRVGRPPKGLVGLGIITREPHEDAHWDVARAAEGQQATFVDIRFSRLAEEPILSAADVKAALPENVNLFTQTPCMIVPNAVAEGLLNSLGYPSIGN